MPGMASPGGSQYLAMDRARFVEILAEHGLVPMWSVRVRREATPALFMDSSGGGVEVPDGLNHHDRDVRWLVIGDPAAGALESIAVRDRAEPWQFRRRINGRVDDKDDP